MTISSLLNTNKLFTALSPEQIDVIASCGSDRTFEADSLLAKTNTPADNFYLLNNGKAALEIYSPERGSIPVQTLCKGEVLGWSWIFPPYRWNLDARAVGSVDAIAFDAERLRKKCEEDPVLGYLLMKRFAEVLAQRTLNTRYQLLDVYGKPDANK